MIAGMRAMYAHDVAGRANAFNPAAALGVEVTEIGPGVVYKGRTLGSDLVVTAFAVEHDDGDPALGYRISYGERSVVLSGDTRPVPALTAASRGADLLVQNVAALGPPLASLPEMAGVTRKLTTPEQAAALFADAKPRLIVYSHIVKKDLPGRSGDRRVVARTRAAGYRGPLVMGRDGMAVLVRKTIKVLPPRSTRGLPELDSKFAGVTGK
jgi:ribonuclease Z